MTKEQLLNSQVESLEDKTVFGKLKRFNSFYFTGVIDEDHSMDLAKLGIKKIVDFKDPEEGATETEALAKKLGVEYVNIPVHGCAALDIEKVKEVNDEIDHQLKKPTLFCCLSGNRVTSWLAAHLVLEYGFSAEEALEKAKAAGMDNENVINGTIELISNY